jgi:sulfate adenylyltransferase
LSLVPVHGGLDVPVNRTLKLSQRKAILAEASDMPKIAVTEADLATVYRWADGTLSPTTGPMNQDVYERVLDEWVIVSGGKKYVWSIPLALPVTDEEAAAIAVGGKAALVGPDGDIVGILEVQSLFDWDKARFVKSVYKTERVDHPGGAIVMNDPRTKLVGGDIWAFPSTPNAEYGHQVLSPSRTRAMIADNQWEKALAFQTRNPLHRAHEYALLHGLQELTRAGHYAGVVLNPLVGQLKGDDIDASTRMRCYNTLKNLALLGEGDKDVELWDNAGYAIAEVFELVGLDIKMFYGGPAEAVMHAIYRQNHGFTHIVIGRKHADAPYFDKTAIWGDFDAQEIFDNLPGELHIEPMKVGFAAYYDHLGRVDLMENHQGVKPFFISGSKVRDILVSGERPDERIVRPQIADILIEAYRASQA